MSPFEVLFKTSPDYSFFNEYLAVHVGLIYGHTTPTNCNLIMFNVFSWVIVYSARAPNVCISPLVEFIFDVMFFRKMCFLLSHIQISPSLLLYLPALQFNFIFLLFSCDSSAHYRWSSSNPLHQWSSHVAPHQIPLHPHPLRHLPLCLLLQSQPLL